jgi:NADPH:quinone reductase
MKAAVYRTNGAPDVLSYEDVADPEPTSNEVLIEVEAISIEGGDLLTRQMLPLPRSPHVVGYCGAGTIIGLGDGVTELRVGQRVTTFGPSGSHAARRAVSTAHCWVLPDGVTAVDGSCVPVAFGTAYEALFELGHITSGSTVFLQGAAGGVNVAAVQLASKAGARVIGTVSNDDQLKILRRLGLDEAIDYRNENVRRRVLELTDGKGVDLAIDPVGGPMTQQVLGATRQGGTVIIVGGSSREPSPIDATSLVRGDLTMHGFMLGGQFHTPRVHAYVGKIIDRIGQGDLEVVVDKTFALEDAVEAHRYAEQRGRIGRVVMVP